MAPNCDTQLVSVTWGGPGKTKERRSSWLANSTHSCANEGCPSESTRAADTRGIKRVRMRDSFSKGSAPRHSGRQGDGSLQRVALDTRGVSEPQLQVACPSVWRARAGEARSDEAVPGTLRRH